MPLYRLLLAVLCAFFYLIALPAHASIDNKGKEFVMAFLPNYWTVFAERRVMRCSGLV